MTTDALLAIALEVGIPFLLAMAGGILAVKALPVDAAKPFQRWVWICVFVFLFVAGIVLAFVQQVRLTNLQNALDAKGIEKEIKSEGEIRYTQGQLDSINKVLAQVVQGGADKTLNSSLLLGALKASQMNSLGVAPPAIQRLTNRQLRERVIQFAKELRTSSSNFQAQYSQLRNVLMNAVSTAPADQMNKAWNVYTDRILDFDSNQSLQIRNTYLMPATEYRDELLRRLGPRGPDDAQKFHLTFWTMAGPAHQTDLSADEMDATADYLEYLARQLPAN